MSYDANLRQLPLFATLPPQHMEWAKAAMRVLRFDVGETVFQQGDEAQGLYLFLNGQGRLVRTLPDGTAQVLGSVGAHQYLNEAALFKTGAETATLEIVQQSHVLFISRRRLQEVVGYHPEMKKYLPIPIEAARAQRREKAFLGQRDNEKMLLMTRRHWWSFARQAWIPALIAIGMFILAGLMPVPLLGFVLVGLAVILPGAVMVYLYLEWRNDEIIITDQRIIRVERTILTMQEHRSEIPLSSVQQITAEKVTRDLFSRIFDYGMVEVRTAGQGGNLVLDRIPNPEGVQDLIFNNRTRRHDEQEREHRNVVRAEVDRVISGGNPNAGDLPILDEPEIYIARPPRGFLPTHFTDEDGDTVYRKHAIYYFRQVFTPLLIMLGAFLVMLFVGQIGVIGYAAGGALFLFGLFWYWWADWDWRHDYYIIGDEMIQLVHRRPFFLQDEDDQVLLERVDNVVARRNGLLQVLLNYGTVKISLVGADRGEEKRFRYVPNPPAVQEEITRRQQRWRSQKEGEQERRRREEIAEYLSAYHETLKRTGGVPPQAGGVPPQTAGASAQTNPPDAYQQPQPQPQPQPPTGAPARPPRIVPRKRPE